MGATETIALIVGYWAIALILLGITAYILRRLIERGRELLTLGKRHRELTEYRNALIRISEGDYDWAPCGIAEAALDKYHQTEQERVAM